MYFETTTEEISAKVKVVLAKYDFVDVSESDKLNEFHMQRRDPTALLVVWGRSARKGLHVQWYSGEGMIELVQTNDVAAIETAVQHALTFIAALTALKECDLRTSQRTLN